MRKQKTAWFAACRPRTRALPRSRESPLLRRLSATCAGGLPSPHRTGKGCGNVLSLPYFDAVRPRRKPGGLLCTRMACRSADPHERGLSLPEHLDARCHGEEKLPVLVWYFGGAFQCGYTAEMEFDGERLARRGLIVVTVNYRVNVFRLSGSPRTDRRAPRGSCQLPGVSTSRRACCGSSATLRPSAATRTTSPSPDSPQAARASWPS